MVTNKGNTGVYYCFHPKIAVLYNSLIQCFLKNFVTGFVSARITNMKSLLGGVFDISISSVLRVINLCFTVFVSFILSPW